MIQLEDYKRMIHSRAWKWLKHAHSKGNTGDIDINDLIGEGNLAFCEARNTYDPKKGAFSTHLWYRLDYKIEDFILYQKSRRSITPDPKTEFIELSKESENISHSNPYIDQEKAYQFKQMLSSLSEEAKEVVNLIFNTPQELVDIALEGTKKMTCSLLKSYLIEKGWNPQQTINTLAEIKRCLHDITCPE